MRKSKVIKSVDSNFPSVDLDTNERFKPLSYYVLGGVDLTGQALKCDTSVQYESDESLSDMDSKGELVGIAVASPNVDIFDIAEKVGTSIADKVSSDSITESKSN